MEGQTIRSLAEAAAAGDIAKVKELVQRGADVYAKDENGRTALIEAVAEGHLDVVRYLAEECGVDVNATEGAGWTALMSAALKGYIEVVRYLIEQREANADAMTDNGWTALMSAVSEGHIEVIRYLVERSGAHVNSMGSYGRTALTKAAGNGHIEVVRYLVDQRGADVNVTDPDGETALMAAAMWGHIEVVRYLAGERCADVNATDDEGLTALMRAAKKGETEVVRYLVEERGADVDARNKDGETAMMRAARRGCIEVIRYLAEERGADVNATADDGVTVLMRAARNGHMEVVRYLVEQRDADVNAMNKDGKAAIGLAADSGHQEIQRFLTPFLPSPQPSATKTTAIAAPSSERSQSCSIPPIEVALTDFVKTGNVGGEFRAKWLDADAAVKLFLPDASHSSFEDEARLWQQLRHPNVIKIYGTCSVGSHLQFFVCEYASNGSLIEHVTSTTVKKRTMWKFLHEAALGLEYLHERGIVHGDLRCSNILIGSDGLSKLSNFGLSGSTSLASSSVGSMRWQSPEVFQGMPSSFASDVYSLGMCLLEAATAKMPWGSESDYDAKYAKVEWAPERDESSSWIVPDCPLGDAHDLVWRMCCQDPDKRASISSVVFELNRLAVQEGSGDHEPERQPAVDLDNINDGKVQKEWVGLQERMEKCSNAQYRQVFDELKKLHARLRDGTRHSTLFAQFHDLLADFQAMAMVSADEALATRLSSTSAASNSSFHTFHRRIQSLWTSMGESAEFTTEQEARWEKQRSELFASGVSGVSDSYLLLKEMESTEEKAAFLVTLEAEVRNPQAKYTSEQVEVMKKAIEVIRSKIDTESVSDLVPDWFIPWYELIVDKWRCLGAGGFGSVYRAKWLDSEVVVKQVILPGSGSGEMISVPSVVESWLSAEIQPLLSAAPTDLTKNKEALTMFRHEVDIWFGFSHPHVIRLFGACHVGRPFFVCEYATNGTLVSYLKDHPDQLWSKLHEAALGVQYLHARGVVHGDLKGNNIVIGSDLKAKVTDFGLSSFSSDRAEARISAASHWVAPECFVGDNARPTFASDIYSLGMCIVEALRVVEGVEFCLPWGRLDNAAVRGNAKRGEIPLKPSICKDNEWELVMRMCKLQSEKRIKISTVVDELAELANITKDSKTEADSVSASLKSVPGVVSSARKFLGELDDSQSELPMYVELWDQLEQVHGLIDGKHCGKYRAGFSSLLGDAHVATKKLQDTNRSLISAAETTMRCFALRRRLDKLLDALSVARIAGREDEDSSQD